TNSFSTGQVTAGANSFVGGLAAVNTGTVTHSFWDTQTSGVATIGAGIGMTTGTLQSGLPTGFGAPNWAIVAGASYPYLTWQVPTGTTPQVVSGIAYSDHGVTPAASTGVSGLLGGNALASLQTGGAVVAGANGYYYFLLAPNTISPPALQVLTFTGGTN